MAGWTGGGWKRAPQCHRGSPRPNQRRRWAFALERGAVSGVLMLGCEAGDVDTGAGVEFGEDMGDMALDCAAGEEQLGGNVRVGVSGGDQRGDLQFGGCERLPAGRRALSETGVPAADAEGA